MIVQLFALMSTIGLIKGRPQDDGDYKEPAPVIKIASAESINDGRYRPSDDGKYRGGNDGKYTGEKTPPPTTRFTTRATPRPTQPPTRPPTTTPTVRTTKIVEAGKQWETIRLENDIVEDGYHYL